LLVDYLHQNEDETQVSAVASIGTRQGILPYQQYLSLNRLHITTTRNHWTRVCLNSSSSSSNSSNSSSSGSGNSFKELQEQLNQQFGEAAWQLQPPVHVGTQIQHCVALASLPNNTDVIVMATGGTDSHVRLFVRMPVVASDMLVAEKQEPDAKQQQQQPSFQLHCQLKGHENWVRGVAFTQVAEDTSSNSGGSQVSLLLATAAQDR
jgi:hypothetical protein